jgi:hypothetical protein
MHVKIKIKFPKVLNEAQKEFIEAHF